MTRQQGIFSRRASKNKINKIDSHIYNYYEKNEGQTIVRLNTVILSKVRVKSINDVAIPDRASNKLRVDSIRLGDFYICDVTHDEILETIFSS